MLTFPGQIESTLVNREDWERVVFTPLDESTAYENLDAYYQREADRRALAEATGIDDDQLLDALIEAGFDVETLPALQLAPIAFAAWASDIVTDEESQAAVWSIYETRLFEHPKAASCVQSWLDKRPERTLWDLWAIYTRQRLGKTSNVVRQVIGRQLLEQATAVALASGGFLGIGRICPAEQMILDDIRSVYRI